ncbi:MAG: cyclase family protein [Defluviicoccus sp.]|nr:cyclase family protein [Defluviicoccus sp.]MDG4592504.1 cyclase family protein [Defluviicoccus sp.]MDS4010975.1 cyclase family protein [Defluviicoccus sp.]MDS4071929.1 cyclase family protein [Defluviicoccus sp.]
MRRILLALALAASAASPAWSGEGGGSAASDSRADLPDGVAPWWPSRYGADDEIGTLNELTPARIVEAVRLVRQGERIDLGRVLDKDTPVFPGRYWHQSVDLAPLITNLRRADAHGRGWGLNEINWITEIQVGTFQVGTQLDSIGHLQIGDRFYNGWKTRDVVEDWGLNRFGIESVPPIVGRGIVVDLAGLNGVERLDKGTVIGVADVERALARQGITIAEGDIVLLHTGWGSLWGKDNALFLSGEPGPGLALTEWLHAKRIAALGTDSWSIGPVPGEDPARPFVVPQTMYVKMGLFGFENLATERLVERGISEFLFVNTHGRTRGSTAAVVAPVAVY